MGDHFVMLVDRLLTESTLEATIEGRNKPQVGRMAASMVKTDCDLSPQKKSRDELLGQKLVECRICQDEDEDSNMESPCSCSGSLKYAHRRCVQRWCNEKGNTMCEICLEQFKPGYTAPPQLFHYGGIPMTFRGNWEVSRRDLHNSHLIAMVATDRTFVDADYYDYSTSSSTRSKIYCHSVALIFMALLVLRHTLPIIVSGDEYSFTVFMFLLLRTAGILLPIYVIVRTLAVFRRRQNHQEMHEFNAAASQGEDRQPLS